MGVTLYKKEECKQDGQGCDLSHHRQLHGDLRHFEVFKVAAMSFCTTMPIFAMK